MKNLNRKLLFAIIAIAMVICITPMSVFAANALDPRGDMNGDGIVNSADAIYLLRHRILPDKYPLSTEYADANGDGVKNSADAIYLLRHTIMPDKYPIISVCKHSIVIDAAVAPTCTKYGRTEGKHCSKCGEVFSVQKTVSATGHNFIDGLCSVCGERRVSKGLLFGANEDGTCYVQDIGVCQDIDIVIPTDASAGRHIYVNGVLVTPREGLVIEIGNSAFRESTDIISVFIPDCIVSIGSYAFKNCINLTEINIPESVIFIGQDAFQGCENLPIITDEYGVQYLFDWVVGFDGDATEVVIREGTRGIAASAFESSINLTKILFPNTLTNIGSNVFKDCKNLKTIYYEGTLEQWCNILFQNIYGNPCSNGVDLYIQGKKLEGELIIPDGLTSIGYFTFAGLQDLTDIIIPTSVTTIKYSAFYKCTGLTEIKIPDSVTTLSGWAFGYCDNLTNVVLSDNLKNIGEYTFYNCSKLTNITLPNNVKSIGSHAFSGCSKLTNITLSENLTSIGEYAFSNCTNLKKIWIPEGVTEINHSTFYNCTYLVSVRLPDTVTSIDKYAFYKCSNLTNINIPDAVTSIGVKAFSNCSKLQRIKIPDGETYIGDETFYGCTSLVSVEIPDSVISIGYRAFQFCRNLTYITIPNNLQHIGDYAFYGCSSLTTDMIFPDGLTTIGEYAFCDCSSLINIVIPNTVTSIGHGAFYSCSNLVSSIELPNNLTRINDSIFWNCENLTSITISDNVKYIGHYAFFGCFGLTDIYYEGTKEQWNSIDKYQAWDWYTGDYTVHYNSEIRANYDMVADFETVVLPASGETVFLIPLHGYGFFKIINEETGELSSWKDSGFYYEINNVNGNFTIDEYGTLVGKKCGIAYLSIYYLDNGKKSYMFEDQPIFVAESSFENGSYARFAESDKKYIAMCLDLAFTLSNVESPSLPDLGIFGIDQVWMGVSNLTENISAFFRDPLRYSATKEELKRNLAGIVQNYVDATQPAQQALSHADSMLKLINYLLNLDENTVQYQSLSTAEKAKLKQIQTAENSEIMLKALSEFLNLYMTNGDIKDLLDDIDAIETVNDVQKAVKSATAFAEYTKDSGLGTLLGVVLEAENITVDTILYMFYDYDANIEVLKLLREELIKVYHSDEKIILAIDELIADYTDVWKSGLEKWGSDMLSMTITEIADFLLAFKFPQVGIVTFIVESFADCSYAKEKSQLYTLALISSALYDSLDPLYDMYMNGKQTVPLDRLETLVSLYLHLVKDENELAWRLWFDYSMDEIGQFGRTANYIKNTLGVYLK